MYTRERAYVREGESPQPLRADDGGQLQRVADVAAGTEPEPVTSSSRAPHERWMSLATSYGDGRHRRRRRRTTPGRFGTSTRKVETLQNYTISRPATVGPAVVCVRSVRRQLRRRTDMRTIQHYYYGRHQNNCKKKKYS